MDYTAAMMRIQIADAELNRNLGFVCETDGGEDPLLGPDSDLRRAHIRQELAKKGGASSSSCGSMVVVDEILSKNATISVEDVMILAARGNMVDVVAYCIETKGADANKFIAVVPCSTCEKATNCFLAAIEEAAAQVVEYLLSAKGGGSCNANSHSQGIESTPALWIASNFGHVYIIELLLQHGADVNAYKRDSGNSALYAAAQNGHALACSVLIQHGADLNFTKQTTPHPVPPLGVAISMARPDIMALLLNAGAKIHLICGVILRRALESKKSNNIPNERQLSGDVLYQMKALLDQAKLCTLLVDTNTQVKDQYQRARQLEHKGKYRQALRALVDAQTAYLELNNYQQPDHFQPSPPAWVQLKLDGERLTNYVYGCKGSDGRVSKWQRHLFYKDDLQPPRVIFTTAVYYAAHKKVYRWGGLDMRIPIVNEEYPLWAFDINLKQWAKVATSGKSPGMRARHCAAILVPYMYVFAGSIGLKRIDNKLFRLHLEIKVWELIKVKGCSPMSRENGAMCVYDGKLYIMGGEDKDAPLTDVWQFNPDNKKWKELRPAPDSPAKPLERFCHGVWACQNKLYVFGGQGLVPNSSAPSYRYQAWSNLQCFDLQMRHWINIPNVGDFTWNFAEFLTLPLYRGHPSEPSVVLVWGGYHETSNPDRWSTHHKYDAEYRGALYGDEFHDYHLPYRRRLLRFDCETHAWTVLKLLDSDIVMPTALCWGAELWDESASQQDDGLTRIIVGGGYGLTHDSNQKDYTPEEKILLEMMGSEIGTNNIEKHLSQPEVSEQVYTVEVLDERGYCTADQARRLEGWAWQFYTTPLSRQPRGDFHIGLGFGSPLCFRVMEHFEQDFFPPSGGSEINAAITSTWPSIQDNDASTLGRRVVLDGLQAKPDLNGKVCRCGVFDVKKQRYQVYLEPERGVAGVVTMAIKSSNLRHADPFDPNDFHSIFMNQQGQKPTPEIAAAWRTYKRYSTLDTRPHNLQRIYENEPSDSSDGAMMCDSYKGPISAEGRAILHGVGLVAPKAQRSISVFYTAKSDIRKEAVREGHDIFANWVQRVHERDAERSKRFLQNIVAQRKSSGWETDEKKATWLRVDVAVDGIEPSITRSIIVSPLIPIHRLHHQVLAPAFGRQSNCHCYAFRQCQKFYSLESGSDWIGPKVSSALDGFFQPFYIGGEMADDQKIMFGDLFFRGQDDNDTQTMYMRYIHDFGDWWSHSLTVTKYTGAVPPDASVAHVLSGYGICPPDDSGGILDYTQKMQQLTGELEMKVDKDDPDKERLVLDDGALANPLKEMWWKVSEETKRIQ
jgi:Plasmid pRiA4b ORF-3-like protein/Ankyrin repeats (3 copies)/Kelch motif